MLERERGREEESLGEVREGVCGEDGLLAGFRPRRSPLLKPRRDSCAAFSWCFVGTWVLGVVALSSAFAGERRVLAGVGWWAPP